MTSQTAPLPPLLLERIAGHATTHVVHVGGGDGAVLAALLSSLPLATGVLFDEPDVVEGAGPVLHTAGVADRVDVVPDNASDAVPPGGDVYLLTAAGSEDILRRCRAAMAPTARLVVCEPAPLTRALNDGLEHAGFEVVSSATADGRWIIVEARPRR